MARFRRSGPQANLARSLNLIAFLPLASRAPTYGRLIWSLMRDDRVPPAQKAVLAVALGYVALPLDILPDRIPLIGALDDVQSLCAYRAGRPDYEDPAHRAECRERLHGSSRPATQPKTAIKASTKRGSSWLPATLRSSSTACSWGSALR